MRRALAALVVVLSACGWFVPSAATPGTVRALSVSGTGADMYPAFGAGIGRYAVTTSDATGGTLQLTATTTDPDGVVLVDGRRTSGSVTTVSGLNAGDEVSVIFDDLAGRTSYSLVYLPAGFPAMAATLADGVQAVDLEPGYLGVGLTTFAGGPSFEGLLDRNGVPAWVSVGTGNDLKRQPDGELTVSRPTTAPGHTGYDLVSLDEQFAETARRHVVGSLVDTDTHDSERLPDGSTILIGYEPRGACGTGYLDATIQKQDADGNAVFTWSSEGLEPESMNPFALAADGRLPAHRLRPHQLRAGDPGRLPRPPGVLPPLQLRLPDLDRSLEHRRPPHRLAAGRSAQ